MYYRLELGRTGLAFVHLLTVWVPLSGSFCDRMHVSIDEHAPMGGPLDEGFWFSRLKHADLADSFVSRSFESPVALGFQYPAVLGGVRERTGERGSVCGRTQKLEAIVVWDCCHT